MALDACRHRYGNAAVDSFATGTFERYYTLDHSLWPVTEGTSCIMELTAFQDYVTNVTGDLGTRAREIIEAYPRSFARDSYFTPEF